MDRNLIKSSLFFRLVTDSRFSNDALRLSDYFNKPGVLEESSNFDDLTRGLATQPQQKTDKFHTSEVSTKYLSVCHVILSSDDLMSTSREMR